MKIISGKPLSKEMKPEIAKYKKVIITIRISTCCKARKYETTYARRSRNMSITLRTALLI